MGKQNYPKMSMFLCSSGRFQQLEILDHVTNAFSSLLNDVNTHQSQAEEKAGRQGMHSPTSSDAKEHQQRMSKLLRRTSRQNIRRVGNPALSESFKMEDGTSTLPTKPWKHRLELQVASISNDGSQVPPSIEHGSPQACNDLLPCLPPQALLDKQWPCSSSLAKQSPQTNVSEGSVRRKTWKEKWIHMDKLKNLSHIVSKGPDSFEMEEVSVVSTAQPPLEMAHATISVCLLASIDSLDIPTFCSFILEFQIQFSLRHLKLL